MKTMANLDILAGRHYRSIVSLSIVKFAQKVTTKSSSTTAKTIR